MVPFKTWTFVHLQPIDLQVGRTPYWPAPIPWAEWSCGEGRVGFRGEMPFFRGWDNRYRVLIIHRKTKGKPPENMPYQKENCLPSLIFRGA